MSSNITPSENFLNVLNATNSFDAATEAYRQSEISNNLNDLYGSKPKWEMATDKEINNLIKSGKKSNALKALEDAYNNAANSKGGKIVGKVIKGGGKIAGKVLPKVLGVTGPIGALQTAYDVYQLGKAGMGYKDAKDAARAQEEMMSNFEALKAQGYDELTAWQMANDITDNETERLKSQLKQSEATLQKEQQLTDAAQARMLNEQRGVYELQNQINQPVAPGPVSQNMANNIRPTQVTQPAQVPPIPPQISQPAQSVQMAPVPEILPQLRPQATVGEIQGASVNIPTQPNLEQALISDVLNTDGRLTQQDIINALNNNFQQMQGTIAQNPYYSGPLVAPNNPYNIDIDRLRSSGKLGEYYTAFTDPSQLANVQANNAQALYQAQLANQTGVPYEDYIRGITQRQQQEIAALGLQNENLLKAQASKATTLKDKLAILQKIEDNRAETQKALLEARVKGEYDLQKQMLTNRGNLSVAQTNAMADIAQEQMRLNDVFNQMNKLGYGSIVSNMMYASPEQAANIMYTMPYAIKQQLGLQNFTYEQMQDFMGKAMMPPQTNMNANFPTFNQFMSRFYTNNQ